MVRSDDGSPTLTNRAIAILQDEIANGALADVRAAGPKWSAHYRDPAHLATGISGLLDTVVDLLAPLSHPSTVVPRQPEVVPPGRATDEAAPNAESITVLRALRSVEPGGVAEIRTGLHNDGPYPVDICFTSNDLVARSGARIPAHFLQPAPGRLRIPPDSTADLTITLVVPENAPPGLYRALLQADEVAGLCALLTFPVHALHDRRR